MNLGKIQLRILKYLYGFAINKKEIRPKQETIAKVCRCSVKHVNNTLRVFRERQLLKLVYRGKGRPKLIKFLVPVNEIFSYAEVMSKVIPEGIEGMVTSRKKELAYFKEILEEQAKKDPIRFPDYIDSLGISFDSKLKLSMCSPSAYYLALDIAKVRHKKQLIKTSIEKYIVGAAISIEIKRKIKLNWKHYYNNRRM